MASKSTTVLVNIGLLKNQEQKKKKKNQTPNNQRFRLPRIFN